MKTLHSWLVILGLLGLTPQATFAQDTYEDEIIRSKGDSYPISISYFPAAADAIEGGLTNAPVVVLLHGDKESRLFWNKGSAPRGTNPFPVELQKRGFAVVTVDLRKHGDSVVEGTSDRVKPTDYGKMVLGDLAAVKEFIQEKHQAQQLNMRKMAIVASGFSAPVALAFAEFDWKQIPYDDSPLASQRTPRGQDVKALVLLSPESSAGKVTATKSINFLRNPAFGISLMVVVGADDNSHYRDARTIYNSFTTVKDAEERAELVTPELKDTGISLMTKPVPVAYVPVLKFLDERVKSLKIPWSDRRSRLER